MKNVKRCSETLIDCQIIALRLPNDCNNYEFRYVRVKYENFVEDTIEMTKKLYEFSEIPFTNAVTRHIKKLSNGIRISRPFNVYRGPDFDFNHWMKELSKQKIKEIENSCEYFMQELQYPNF